MLAKTKLDSIETLVSQALIDMEISHEEFNAIFREKQNMRGWIEMLGTPVSAAPLKKKKIWNWIVRIQKKKKKRVCNRCVSLKQNLNEKQSKIIYLLICAIKKFYFFCVCVCIKWTHLLYLLQSHVKKWCWSYICWENSVSFFRI